MEGCCEASASWDADPGWVWKETVAGTGDSNSWACVVVGTTETVAGLRMEETWFTTWHLAPVLNPRVREEIRERRDSSSSREMADGGSAIAKTTGDRKTDLGSLTCWT